MRKIRGIFRLLILIKIVIAFLTYYSIVALFKGRSLEFGLKLRHGVAKLFPMLLGIDLDIKGKPIDEPAIYVSNHRSYYDPGGIFYVLWDAVVVAKAEVRNWPLLGYAADLTGIIFVKRESQDSRRETRAAMMEQLKAGHSILIYPEGTTADHQTTLEFRPGTFVVAAKLGVPVVPVAVEYPNVGDAWVDKSESFVRHYIRYFGKRRNKVKMRFGPPINEPDVDICRKQAQAWVSENLLEMQEEFGGVTWPGTAKAM